MNHNSQLIRRIRSHINDYDDHGIPVLNKPTISKIAELVLRHLDSNALRRPQPANVLAILDYLRDSHSAEILIHDLGERDGLKILGRTVFSKNRIELDVVLTQEHPAFRFVVAHELGHWFLHRWKAIAAEEHEQGLDESTETEDVVFRVYRTNELQTSVDWLEFQANYFAASLVMPERPLLVALRRVQVEHGIERRNGEVWLNPDNQSQADFAHTIEGLRTRFGVSKKATIVRLHSLGVLRVHQSLEENTVGFTRLSDPRAGSPSDGRP